MNEESKIKEYPWLSFGFRILMNVEAANMVESIGNYIRKRKVSLVIYNKDKKIYRIVTVPAISGNSINYGYSSNLVDIALKKALPLCIRCRNKEFLKHCAGDLIKEDIKAQVLNKSIEQRLGGKGGINDMYEIEKAIVSACVVEDVTGFMNPNTQTRRTGKISFSYLVPAAEEIVLSEGNAIVEPQFHTRQARNPNETFDKGTIKAQSIFNVEIASALYVLSGYLDLHGISLTSYHLPGLDKLLVSEDKRKGRILAALEALWITVEHGIFGAKKHTFNPHYEVTSGVIVLSNSPFNVSTPHKRAYIGNTIESADNLTGAVGDLKVEVFYFVNENQDTAYVPDVETKSSNVTINKLNSISELFKAVYERINEL